MFLLIERICGFIIYRFSRTDYKFKELVFNKKLAPMIIKIKNKIIPKMHLGRKGQ